MGTVAKKKLFESSVDFESHLKRAAMAALREDFDRLFQKYEALQRIEIKIVAGTGYQTGHGYNPGSVTLQLFTSRDGNDNLPEADLEKIRKRFNDTDLNKKIWGEIFAFKTWKFYRMDGDPAKETKT